MGVRMGKKKGRSWDKREVGRMQGMRERGRTSKKVGRTEKKRGRNEAGEG